MAGQTFPQFEVVVIDNASTDGSAAALRLPDGRFRLHLAGANLGFAAANNLGAADCGADFIVTLNPDTVPGATWLEELRNATLRHQGVKVFGSTQIDARQPELVDGFGDVYSVFGTAWRGASRSPVAALPPDDREVFAPCAAAALYAREAFASAGGFDESFFCYLEDVDLGFRLQLRGERCIQVRRAEVLHFGSVSTGRDSDFLVFHTQRNRLWVLLKNVPSPLLWLTLALQIAVVPLTVLRRPPGKWRTALKGVIAGFRGFATVWRQRRKVQSERVVSSLDIAKVLVWDPRKALRQAPHFLARPPCATDAPQAASDA